MGLRRSWWTTAVVAVLVAGCGGSAGRAAPARTAVAPTTGLYDVSRSIVVSRLRPGEVVTISATTPRPDGLWSASATYTADGAGEVDLARVAPRSGSYRGVSATGLLWSQHLVRAGSAAARRTVTTLTVSAGEREVGSASISQALAAPSVTEHAEQLAKTGFVGRYFTPSGSARHPAVIVWGGSEGGLGASPSYAALLASHGIPALALAYFDEPGLPCALDDIPLEYFVKAIEWLRAQPQVDPRRVWILSASRGSEADLLVAAHWPALAHGVVAVAPSSVVWGANPGQCQARDLTAWTLHGQPLASATAESGASRNPDGSFSERAAFVSGLTGPDAAAARIPIERSRGPVMLISGGADQLWPSTIFADRIMTALHADPARHVHLNYPLAGHLVFGIPSVPEPVEQRGARGFLLDLGGTASGDDAAHVGDWAAAIRFILTN
ncbi:MAG TPA: acyl-CoA thioesterase/bile acid-CoA:amino acid N-acyltransferase family protein [Solirubrobacteraceae bacterium]|nr:acyl-CoA thioesterase/bile acid-CoA:amino acid N-acyltransferase family protein [Solirubrobacteraceae bacterium]